MWEVGMLSGLALVCMARVLLEFWGDCYYFFHSGGYLLHSSWTQILESPGSRLSAAHILPLSEVAVDIGGFSHGISRVKYMQV